MYDNKVQIDNKYLPNTFTSFLLSSQNLNKHILKMNPEIYQRNSISIKYLHRGLSLGFYFCNEALGPKETHKMQYLI